MIYATRFLLVVTAYTRANDFENALMYYINISRFMLNYKRIISLERGRTGDDKIKQIFHHYWTTISDYIA